MEVARMVGRMRGEPACAIELILQEKAAREQCPGKLVPKNSLLKNVGYLEGDILLLGKVSDAGKHETSVSLIASSTAKEFPHNVVIGEPAKL